MAEYIERETLLKELQEEIDFETTMYTEEQNKWFERGLKCAYRDAKNQPTADVVEVRHGEWEKENGIYVCSECGYTCPYDVVGDNIEYWECLYCRHCGAKMDGGKDENV